MAFVIADRVRETTTTTGTGAVTLAGAYVSFQTFLAAIGNGNNTYYTIASAATGEWEVGIGTYSSGPNSLSRDTILASSSGGAAVNFSAGPKDVFVTQPSERSLLLNAASNGLFAGNPAFTANGIPYANSTTTLTTGSALTFDGMNLGVGGTATALGTYRGAEFAGTTATTGGFLRMRTSDSSVNSLDFTDANGRGIFTTTNHPLRFGVNDSEQMRLTSTGLGIGTSSPGTKLEVVGVITTTSGSAKGYLYSDGTNINLETNGAYPIRFRGGASTATWATLDASGNLGLGVTPSAWSGFRALQVGGATSIWSSASGAGSSFYSNNVYFDGSNRRRINAGFATEYIQDSSAGAHLWFTAASSTAGSTISFTQAMTLDASGLLAIGRTSAWDSNAILTLEKSGVAAQVLNCTTNTVTLINVANGGASIAYTGTASNHPFAFYTNGSERARIDASGNFGLGVTPSAWGGAYRAIEFPGFSIANLNGGTNQQAQYLLNAYDSSAGTWIYKITGVGAAMYRQASDGSHEWHRAPSGTAGAAISFTQAMTLTADGNLGIGTTSLASRLGVAGSAIFSGGVGGSPFIAFSQDQTGATPAYFQWASTTGLTTFYTTNAASANGAFAWFTAGAERMRLDASGNLGLGVTPSAWLSTRKAFQNGNAAFVSAPSVPAFFQLSANTYTDSGGTDRYISSAASTNYAQVNGAHQWFTAPSGTAGNAISFTQAMTLDASGNLGVGTTSPVARIHAQVSSSSTTYLSNVVASLRSNGSGADATLQLSDNVSNSGTFTLNGGNLIFGINSTERARIDSSGNLGLGVTPSAWLSGRTAIQLGGTVSYFVGNSVAAMSANNFFNGSNVYIGNGFATQYAQSAGQHIWFTAPSGTAGSNISFTQAMTLDANGNLGVGTTNPAGARINSLVPAAAANTTSSAFRFGNGTSAGEIAFTASTYSYAGVGANELWYYASSGFNAISFGSDGAVPIKFVANGAERMRLDSSGNLGLGVTPSAWGSLARALEIGSGASTSLSFNFSETNLGTNVYRINTGASLYKANGIAMMYSQSSGGHAFFTAPSGTAGNVISFTQAMTLNANSTLSLVSPVNTTQAQITLADTDGRTLAIRSPNSGAPNIAQIGTTTNHDLAFLTGNTERARIDTSGNFIVGGTSPVITGAGRGNITINGASTAIMALSVGGTARGWVYTDGTDMDINNPSGATRFWNNSAERARIDSSGNLLVGTTSDGAGIGVASRLAVRVTNGYAAIFRGQQAGNAMLTAWNSGTSGDSMFHEFGTETSYTVRGSIDYNRAAGQVRYNTTSDATFKNILGNAPQVKSLEILDSVVLREYAWKNDESQTPQIGVIAQELYETFPGAVSVGGEQEETIPAKLDDLGNVVEPEQTIKRYKPWAVDKTAFTFHLIAGYQAQKAQISELIARIEALEARLASDGPSK